MVLLELTSQSAYEVTSSHEEIYHLEMTSAPALALSTSSEAS